MPVTDGAASIFATATRITALDVNGYPDAGAAMYTTASLIKATVTPVYQTGDDIAIINAAGDMPVHYKHGDMPKYATLAMELATPDPFLEQLLAGGTVYTDTGAALGLPTGLAATAQATLGTLAAGTYGYRATQYNSYGETLAESEVTATTTGSTGAVVLSGVTMAAGAIGVRYYGRTPGLEQLLGTSPNIGSQTTSAASGTGAVSTLAVTNLTAPIPAGTTFTIAGDTNNPKIVWTVNTTAGVGAASLSATPSQSVTTTIAAGAIQPVFVDNGSVTPLGNLPTSDTTAGPGSGVGYQAPALGIVGAPYGVSLEFFSMAIVNGQQATTLPFYRWVLPKATNLHIMPRDITNANAQTIVEGQIFENANWGTGPVGDWKFDSTKYYQRARCSRLIVPTPSVAGGVATT